MESSIKNIFSSTTNIIDAQWSPSLLPPPSKKPTHTKKKKKLKQNPEKK